MELPRTSNFGYAVLRPKTQADVDKLGMAVGSKLARGRSYTYVFLQITKLVKRVLRGMGELHLEIIIDSIEDENSRLKINQGSSSGGL